jgi:hypothetical protein
MQYFFMDQLHEHEFTLLLTNVVSVFVRAHLHFCAGPTSRGLIINSSEHPFISFILYPFSYIILELAYPI